MPYKCEHIKIANTQYDKRIKLSEDDKEEIQERYARGESMRSLSRVFKVDRQVIKYTIFKDYKEQFYKANRERVKPEIEKEKRNEYARNHRRYKNELYKSKKIDFR